MKDIVTKVLDVEKRESRNITPVRVGIPRGRNEIVARYFFEIPLNIPLELGDEIHFYACTPTIYGKDHPNRRPATEGTITHDNYSSAEISRKGKRIITIDGEHMLAITKVTKR